MEKLQETAMGLILHGGNAKGHALRAIELAKEDKFAEAEEALAAADEEFKAADAIQKGLITDEARGQGKDPSLLLAHGEDHVMTALTIRELALELVDLHRRLAEVREA